MHQKTVWMQGDAGSWILEGTRCTISHLLTTIEFVRQLPMGHFPPLTPALPNKYFHQPNLTVKLKAMQFTFQEN